MEVYLLNVISANCPECKKVSFFSLDEVLKLKAHGVGPQCMYCDTKIKVQLIIES